MSSREYLRLQSRRRRRVIAPAGWLALSLTAAVCLGFFAAGRAAPIVCQAMAERCIRA